MPRFRQSFGASPPDAPFKINTNSMQSAGLVAWWPPGRYPGIGYGVPDMAGNLPMAQVGTLGWRYDPILGWSPDYVADSSKYLSAGTSNILKPASAMTLSIWMNSDAIATECKMLDNDSNGSRGWWLGLNGSKPDFGINGNLAIRGQGAALSSGVTYHIVIAGLHGGAFNLYTNGVLIFTSGGQNLTQSTNPTLISRGSYGGYEGPFNGTIGDVRIYNRKLSAAEVWQLYDPITRWELYKPLRRMWEAAPAGATPPPSAPTTLTATAVSSSQINLTWVDTSADETGFKIQRSTDGVTYAAYDTAAADATTYNDVACAANTRYWYKVCATNAGGDSAYTSPANAKTAPSVASKHYKFLFINGGQVEQSDGRYIAFEKDVPPPGTVAGITWLYSEVGGALTGSRLHLPAGSAAAKGGPLKFDSGALLATPEAGSMEFYDGRWYITGTAKQRVIDRTGGVIVATTTVANSNVETTLWTEALSANAMKVGRIYKLRTNGVASNASAADDLTFNVYFGATLLVTYNPAMGALAANAPWVFDSTIVIRTVGAPGSCAVHSDATIGGSSSMFSALVAVDTTVATGITLKVRWNNAKAGNTISIWEGYLELKN